MDGKNGRGGRGHSKRLRTRCKKISSDRPYENSSGMWGEKLLLGGPPPTLPRGWGGVRGHPSPGFRAIFQELHALSIRGVRAVVPGGAFALRKAQGPTHDGISKLNQWWGPKKMGTSKNAWQKMEKGKLWF